MKISCQNQYFKEQVKACGYLTHIYTYPQFSLVK